MTGGRPATARITRRMCSSVSNVVLTAIVDDEHANR
jgi:hypothetical protein